MSQTVFLSVGSNIDREKNIRSALQTLAKQFGHIKISPVYESEAVGFHGDAFFNLIVEIQTELELTELVSELKQIEDQHGRDREGPKFSSRSLDIDVVTFGNQVGEVSGIELPRPELYYNSFVLQPMADLCGDRLDPKTGKSYRELLSTLKNRVPLKAVDLAV